MSVSQPKEKAIIQLCLALSILFLPVAQWKVSVAGIPLYSIEIPVLLAFISYIYGLWRGTFSLFQGVFFRNPLVIGIGLFLFGAALSFVANPFFLTGLGMIKTWFVVPLFFVWLWLETRPINEDVDQLLLVWFGVISVSSLLCAGYLALGMLTYDGRLTAWFASPNYLALFLASGVFLAHYFYFHVWFSKREVWKGIIFLELCLLTSLLFFTHSYAVWVSIALTGLAFLHFDRTNVSLWRKKFVAIVLLLTLLGTFFIFESSSEKWQSLVSFQERSSLSSRMTIWHVATKAIADHPLFGIGIGRFQEVYLAYQKYYPPYLEWAVPQPHNLYLAVWLEAGVIGLLGFAFLVTSWLKKMILFQQAPVTEARKKTGALLLSLLLLYLIFGLVDTPFFKTDQAFIFWLIIAFGMSLIDTKAR